MSLVAICKDTSMLNMILIAKTFIKIMQIFVPVLIIIFTGLDIVKGISSGDQDKIQNAYRSLPRRLAAGMIVFMVPIVIEFISDNVNQRFTYSTCWDNANTKTIASLLKTQVNDALKKAEKDLTRTSYDDAMDLINRVNDAKTKKTFEDRAVTLLKKIEEEEAKKNKVIAMQSGVSNYTPSPGGGTTTPTTPEVPSTPNNTVIFFGDSRTEGMCSDGGCESNKSVSKIGASYPWAKGDGLDKVTKILDPLDYKNSTVMFWFGINDVEGDSSADRSFTNYKKLLTTLAGTSWKNVKIVVISLTPRYEAYKTYDVNNTVVKDFNSKMKSFTNSYNNLFYCDVTSNITLTSSDYAKDGIHHTTTGYKKIYNYIKSNCM